MYEYYLKVVSNEHMLYLNELAELYDLYSLSGKPHIKLLKAIILDYLQENCIEYYPIFYNSKNGLKEVFSHEVYMPAIERFNSLHKDGVYISCNNKFNFKRRRGED